MEDVRFPALLASASDILVAHGTCFIPEIFKTNQSAY